MSEWPALTVLQPFCTCCTFGNASSLRLPCPSGLSWTSFGCYGSPSCSRRASWIPSLSHHCEDPDLSFADQVAEHTLACTMSALCLVVLHELALYLQSVAAMLGSTAWIPMRKRRCCPCSAACAALIPHACLATQADVPAIHIRAGRQVQLQPG